MPPKLALDYFFGPWSSFENKHLVCVQAIPIGLGLPLTTYITMGSGPRAGYYFSAAFVLAGTAMLSLIDVHKNNLRRRRRRRRRQNSCKREEEVMNLWSL